MQLYLGYLDQETSGIVSTILEEQPGRKLIAIGPGLETGNVFGMSYQDAPKVCDVKPEPKKDKGIISNIPGSEDATTPTGSSGDVVTALRDAGKADDRALTWLRVAEFPSKSNGAQDLAVVLRTPMTGRDPDSLNLFFRTLLPGLAHLPQASDANGGIRISSFGTAGGIDPKLVPGQSTPVKASLFVGSVFAGTLSRYNATIQFAQLGSKAPPLVLFAKEFPSKTAADDAARDTFFRWLGGNTDAPNAADLQRLQAAVATSAGTSLTTSFFAGPDVKSAAGKLGLSNVNMEDFHLICLLNSPDGAAYRSATIDRVVTDPAVLPAKVSAAVRAWYANARYTRERYRDAIVWGISGSDVGNAPESARWDVFAKIPQAEAARWVSQISFPGGKGTLDPFFYDISRWFVESAVDRELNLGGFVNPYARGLSQAGQKQWQKALDAKESEVRERAGELVELSRSHQGAKDPALAAAIDRLLDSVYAFRVSDEPLRTELAHKLSPARAVEGPLTFPLLGDPHDPARLRIWVNTNNTLSDEAAPDVAHDVDPSDEAINRSLYKLSLIGLKESATVPHTRLEFRRMEQEAHLGRSP